MSSSTTDLVMESIPDLPQKVEEEKPKTFRTMSNVERLKYIKEVITIEPIVAAYILAPFLCSPSLSRLEIEKACRVNLNYSDTICEAILTEGVSHNYTDENQEIQLMVSNMHAWQLPVQSVMPLVLVLFLGSYSDRHQMRKPFFLIPLFGELFAIVGCILCVIFMKELPLEVQGVLQVVVPSFFGGLTMFVMGIFSYLADASSLEMRTLRFGIVQIVIKVCEPIAESLSGILFVKLGYIGMLLIAAFLYLFGLVYGIFCVKEVKKIDDNKEKKSFFKDAFDPKHAIDTFNVLLKKKPGNDRTLMVLILLIFLIYSVVAVGEFSILYLYLTNVFHWGPLQYSYFTTTNTIAGLIGTSAGIFILTKLLKLTDPMILIIVCVDIIIAKIVLGLAKTKEILYLGAIVGLISGIFPIPMRSLATKTVSQDDLGKAQSLFGVVEALGPLIGGPIYNAIIYRNTLQKHPSSYFYFGALLYAACMAVIIIMYFRLRKLKQNEQQTQNGQANTYEEKYITTQM